MYIAMNRFQVRQDSEEAFEQVWKQRDSSLSEVPGFVEFRLLRGPEKPEEGLTLFASHTVWASEKAFLDWTKSQNFRDAHKNAGENKVHYSGHPVFEGFHVVEGA